MSALVRAATPKTFTAYTCKKSSVVVSKKGLFTRAPALFTSTSKCPPHCCATKAAAFLMSFSLEISNGKAYNPSNFNASMGAGFLESANTWCPCATYILAISKPIPLLVPVITIFAMGVLIYFYIFFIGQLTTSCVYIFSS